MLVAAGEGQHAQGARARMGVVQGGFFLIPLEGLGEILGHAAIAIVIHVPEALQGHGAAGGGGFFEEIPGGLEVDLRALPILRLDGLLIEGWGVRRTQRDGLGGAHHGENSRRHVQPTGHEGLL